MKQNYLISMTEKLKLVLRFVLNCILVVIFFGLPAFMGAGTLRYWNVWLFIGIFDGCFLSIILYFIAKNPQLVRSRLKGEETEKPQRIVMTLLVLCALIMFAVAGLDFRYYWSKVPIFLVAIFCCIMVGGFIILFLVMKQNSYTSRVVEIQEDQVLITTGFYAVVRHPMYLGFSLIFCFAPIVLGSWFAFIPAACIPFLLTFRIKNEEEVLQKGLEGYKEYMEKVRWRLIPCVW